MDPIAINKSLTFTRLLLILPLMIGCRRDLVQTSPKNGRKTPSTQGQSLVNQAALDTLLSRANASHSDAIVILKDGQLIGAWYSGGKVRKIETMSGTKSVVNLAIGRLLTLGAIDSLDQPVHTFFPEWAEGPKAKITLRHLLNHTSGMETEVYETWKIYQNPDFVKHALNSNIISEPGSTFLYNNRAVNLLAGIVEKASGKKMDDFFRDDLFAKLGISDFAWTRDQAGNPHGMAGLRITPENWAKIGQFVLDRGRHNQEQLIEESWFDVSLQPGSELNAECGLLWWIRHRIDAYIIDDEQIARLRDAGVTESFLSKVVRLKGRYDSRERYYAALVNVLGARFNDVLTQELVPLQMPLSQKEYGEQIAYMALGWLGQQLVIIPQDRIVGVRMIEASDSRNESIENFEDFPDRLFALASDNH